MPENNNEEYRTRVSYKRVAIFVLAVALLIVLMGDNAVSRYADGWIKLIGSMFKDVKDAKPGPPSSGNEMVYRLAGLAMVLITIVGIFKLLTRGRRGKKE